MSIKITSLHLENYRCFTRQDIDFDQRLTVLVGVNGSGKTAVLDALGFFLKIYAEPLASQKGPYPVYLVKQGAESALLSCTFGDPGKKDNRSFEVPLRFIRTNMSSELAEDVDSTNLLNLWVRPDKPKLPVGVVAYYSAKRELDTITKNNSTNINFTHAYANAFSPQINFSSTLSWFIERATQEALEAVQKKDFAHKIADLSAVRAAVSQALGEYGEPFVGETPPVLFLPLKDDPQQVFRIEELSDGYRTMLALIMDLARRMAVANEHVQWPEGQSVLHSPGIVLIDEVELHLHPSWQQTVLPRLMEIFPQVQFIVTTHSPQVLTSIAARHIRILKDSNVYSFPEETEGAEAGRVLEDVLGVLPRPPQNRFTQLLETYANLVYCGKWDSPDAQRLRTELDEHYGDSEPKLMELALHIENSKWEQGL